MPHRLIAEIAHGNGTTSGLEADDTVDIVTPVSSDRLALPKSNNYNVELSRQVTEPAQSGLESTSKHERSIKP